MGKKSYRRGSHTVYELTVHVVFSTKYRYHVLKVEVQVRCRDLIRQVCDVMDIQVIKGVVSKDHVHIHMSYRPKSSVSEIMRRIKGMTSKKLQEEFPHLRKRYWGKHFWSIGYGAQNMALLRHIALNKLKNEKTLKRDIKAKRKKAGWNDDYLIKVLLT